MKTIRGTRSTEDMHFAAFMAIHFPGYWLEGKETGKATFVFDVKDEGRYFDELSQAYWAGAPEALIHPKRYAASLKDIKSRLYNE